jgi:hypothetical protein
MSKIDRQKVTLIAALLLMLSLSGTAVAGELGYCDAEEDPDNCECPAQLTNHDSCTTIDAAELINPADVEAYREAIGLTPSWNERTGELQIEADFTNFNGGGILPLHENGGHWNSFGELHAYIDDLVGMSYVDEYCETGTLPHPTLMLNGTIARWDQSGDMWAEAQIPDPVWAAISDQLGRVWVDDELVAYWEMLFTGCDYEADGDLSGTQCSGTIYWTYEIDRRILCTEFDPGMETWTANGMGTEQKDFIWKDSISETKAIKDDNGEVIGYIGVLVFYDRSDIHNVYYDSNGNAVNPNNPHKSPQLGSNYNRITSGEEGVCGDGIAEKSADRLDFMSMAGTAPHISECPQSL